MRPQGRFLIERSNMLLKEMVGKLNSFNMDAEVEFAGGDDFEVELVDNESDRITDEGNAKRVIFKIVEKPVEEAPEMPATEPDAE